MKKWLSIFLGLVCIVACASSFAGANFDLTPSKTTVAVYQGIPAAVTYTITSHNDENIMLSTLDPNYEPSKNVTVTMQPGSNCKINTPLKSCHFTLDIAATGSGSVTPYVCTPGSCLISTVPVSTVAIDSLTITPTASSIPVSQTQQFNATGLYADGTSQPISNATWNSSSAAIVKINSTTGLATAGAAPGQAIISAEFIGQKASTPLTVTDLLGTATMTPSTITLAPTQTQTFSVSVVDQNNHLINPNDYAVKWSGVPANYNLVSSGNSATITPTDEAASTTATLTATVTSTIYSGNPQQATASITVLKANTLGEVSVTPASASVNPGGSQTYSASVVDQNNNPVSDYSVKWSVLPDTFNLSENGNQATITASADAKAGTQATITASVTSPKYSGNPQGTATLSVDDALQTVTIGAITPGGSNTVAQGYQSQLFAVGTFVSGKKMDMITDVAFTSSNPDVKIENGVLTVSSNAKVGDTAIISAEISNIKSNIISLTIGKPVPVALKISSQQQAMEAAPGGQLQLVAQELLSNGTTAPITTGSVNWSSGNSNMVPINSAGQVTIANEAIIGTRATITAVYTLADGTPIVGTTELMVSPIASTSPNLMLTRTVTGEDIDYDGTVVIKNVGSRVLTDLNAKSSDSAITQTSTTCGSLLQPQESCNYVFTAKALPISASGVILISGKSAYHAEKADAVGVPVSAISVTPFSPPVNPTNNASMMLVQGCVSKPQLLLVTNLSNAPINNITASAGAGLGSPTINSSNCSSASLAPNGLCEIAVTPSVTTAIGDHGAITVSGTGTVSTRVIAAVEADGAPLPASGALAEGNTVFNTNSACNIATVYSNNDVSNPVKLPWDPSVPPQSVGTYANNGQLDTVGVAHVVGSLENHPLNTFAAGACLNATENSQTMTWYLPEANTAAMLPLDSTDNYWTVDEGSTSHNNAWTVLSQTPYEIEKRKIDQLNYICVRQLTY